MTAVDGRTVDVEIPYNIIDRHGTVWLPGCFTASLQRKLPPVVMQHNHRDVVGKVIGFRDTATALQLSIRLADPSAVPDARRAQSLLRDGIIDQVSFAFVKPNWINQRQFGKAPACKSCDLDEVSFVLVGSVPGARVLALRSSSVTMPSRYAAMLGDWTDAYEHGDLTFAELADATRALEEAVLDEQVEVTLALLTLRGHHHYAYSDEWAQRAYANTVETQRQANFEKRLPQIQAQRATDATPPTPTSDYFGTDQPVVVPDPVRQLRPLPAAPPPDVVQAEMDSKGLSYSEVVRQYRQRNGLDDVPPATHLPGRPLPPSELVAAAIDEGLTPAEIEQRWRESRRVQ